MALFTKKKTTDGEKTADAREKKPSVNAHAASIAYRVLLRPHVTEKAGKLAEENQYVFRVHMRATKSEIKRAVYEAYGMRALAVTTTKMPRKRRRLGKSEGWVSGYKKATVTLPEGKTIEVLPR